MLLIACTLRCASLLWPTGLAARESVANKKYSTCNRAEPYTCSELSPVLSDPLLNYERMWVSPFSKLKGNICLINVILICLYWTLNNNLPSSHSPVSSLSPWVHLLPSSDFLNIYLWDLSNFSIDWWDTVHSTVISDFLWDRHNLLAN